MKGNSRQMELCNPGKRSLSFIIIEWQKNSEEKRYGYHLITQGGNKAL